MLFCKEKLLGIEVVLSPTSLSFFYFIVEREQVSFPILIGFLGFFIKRCNPCPAVSLQALSPEKWFLQ